MMHRPPHASTSTTSPNPQHGKVVDRLAVDTPGGLVFGHLTIAGHNQAATLIWPKVQPLLQ